MSDQPQPTPEEVNRAIAESLGYKWKPKGDKYGPLCHPWIAPDGSRTPSLPNFWSSLDACAEMENSILDLPCTLQNDILQKEYGQALRAVCRRDGWKYAYREYRATAPQRCEAYLRLKGLWRWG